MELKELTAELLTELNKLLTANYGTTLEEVTANASELQWISYPKYHPPKGASCIVKIRRADGTYDWDKAVYDGSWTDVVAWRQAPTL